MTARILLLSTYPAIDPQHGGQKRTLALGNAYRDAGFCVVQTAVFCQAHYSSHSTTDIPVSRRFESMIYRSAATSDVLCGRAVTEDAPVRHNLEQLLQGFRPEVIHVEQPYLYPGLRQLLVQLGQRPLIVYGSQNIEAPMKRHILTDAGWAPKKLEAYCAKIHRLEVAFSRDCDLLAACTQADLVEHRRFGARRTVLATNGIEEIPTESHALKDPDHSTELRGKKIVLFIGSAHRPNLVGYRDMIGWDLSFLPDDCRLVIAGGIVHSIRHEVLEAPARPGVAPPVLAGRLDEPQLRDLIERAEVILLPITIGGGSNLKTAEAIAADRKTVATTPALRSFEWFRDFPNVWVADTQKEYHAAIREALRTPRVPRTGNLVETAAAVYWRNCLHELVQTVGTMHEQRRDKRGGSEL